MTPDEARRHLTAVAAAISNLPHDRYCHLWLGRSYEAYDMVAAAGGTPGQSDAVSLDGQMRRHRWCSLRIGAVTIEASASSVDLRVVEVYPEAQSSAVREQGED